METTFEQQLERPVKSVLADFPALGALLGEFRIGCVDCGVGTCKFKDILDIHRLDPEAERALWTRLAGIVEPGRTAPLPRRERAPAAPAAAASPPIRQLVAEHRWILRWAAVIPRLVAELDLARAEDRQTVLAGVDFIRHYADRRHHGKEEDILFRYFDSGLDVLQTMLTDHAAGRAHVRAIEAGVAARDGAAVREHLLAYAALIREHIRKEDDVLFPWLDRQLLDSQVGQMYAQFLDADRRFDRDPRQLENFVADLEARFDAASAAAR